MFEPYQKNQSKEWKKMSNNERQYILNAIDNIRNFDIIIKMHKNAKVLEKFTYLHGADAEEESRFEKEVNKLRQTLVGHLPHEYFNEIETYFGMPANSLLNDYFNGIFLNSLDHCYMTVFGKYMDDIIDHKEKTNDFEFVLVFLLFLVRKKLTKTLPRIIVWDVDSQPNLQLN